MFCLIIKTALLSLLMDAHKYNLSFRMFGAVLSFIIDNRLLLNLQGRYKQFKSAI